MAYNPYGAPAAQGPMAPPPMQGGDGTPQPWEASEVVSSAWSIVKVHWVPLVFGTMIGGAAAGAPQQVASVYNTIAHGPGKNDFSDPVYLVLLGVGAIVGWVLQAFFQAGFVRMYLSAARGQSPEFAHVFSGGPHFFRMLGAMIIHSVLVILGFVLLVVPGVILSLGLLLYPYYVVDQGMSPVDALKASWAATTGEKGKIFVLGLYSFGIMVLGMLACCVGTLPALAVVTLAQAIVYTRLSGRIGTPQTGYGAPPQNPYGGYGAAPPNPYGNYGPPQGGYGGYGPPPGGYGPR